ncbi:hypothetical protein GYA25_02595 [Candidatus Woesearchaeota archaeon]|nr:hypothetical protein [Candidatus Woesearchaeota archaeon]
MKKSKNKSVKKSSNSKNISPKSKFSNKKENKKEVKNKIQKDNSKLKTFFNKNKPFIIGSIIFLVLLLILLAVQFNSTGKVITGYGGEGSTVNAQGEKISWGNELTTELGIRDSKTLTKILKVIFGAPTKIDNVPDFNVLIMTICIWILIFVTFGDIISQFSTFSKGIPWVISFVIVLILAQFNWQFHFIMTLAKIFSIGASTAVFVGLGGAFFAFLVVNLGIRSLAKWFAGRKLLMITSKAEAGAKLTGDAIRNLGTLEESFKKVGNSELFKK